MDIVPPEGLSGFDITFTADPSIVRLTGATFPQFGLTSSSPVARGLQLRVADISRLIEGGERDALLVTIDVDGVTVGSTLLEGTIARLDDDGGFPITATITSGTVLVTSLTPGEQADNELIEAQSLHVKFDTQLVAMHDSHAAKVIRVQEGVDRFEDADGFRGAIWDHIRSTGGSRAEGLAEATRERTFYRDKRDKLNEIVRLIGVEQGFRRDGKVIRAPIG